MDLKDVRQQIDALDAILATTYEKRLELVQAIAEYKDQHQLPVSDEERDAEIMSRLREHIKNQTFRPFVEAYMQQVVSMSNEFLRNHMRQHIFIIGMPGAGKTTLGKALAQKLEFDFYDLDQEIQNRTGKTIQNIIIYDGEESFRNHEYEVIRELVNHKPSVIATGGGTVLSEDTVTLMRNNGIVVFVQRSVPAILDDLDLEIRPLVKESIEYIFRVYEERYPLYKQVSHIQIENENSVAEAVDAIIEALPKSEK